MSNEKCYQVKRLIRIQATQIIKDADQYITEKYKIRRDAVGNNKGDSEEIQEQEG